MLELQGKYAKATVFTDNVEQEAMSQIIELCNQDFVQGCNIAIMPDVHAGKGCVIGFTASLGDKVIPNIVGVDIGCGMLVVELGQIDIDLTDLDRIIHQYVPSGFEVHEGRQTRFSFTHMRCHRELKDTKRLERAIGTLGGGNHFIELNQDDQRNTYLVIHTGSRNLGKQVAEFYQKLAIDLSSGKDKMYEEQDLLISLYKNSGRKHLIEGALKDLRQKYVGMHPKHAEHLCFLTGGFRQDYIADMQTCELYAHLNRNMIAGIILKHLNGSVLADYEQFETVHNYVAFRDNIIRKGSVAAYQGEKLIIPMNMRDGSIIATGKSNPAWNYSAPHGAGRLMSRSKAKELLSMDDYKTAMQGVHTTSVSKSTLDEAPMAYKPMEEIIANIGDTVDIVSIVKPIYNFKAS